MWKRKKRPKAPGGPMAKILRKREGRWPINSRKQTRQKRNLLVQSRLRSPQWFPRRHQGGIWWQIKQSVQVAQNNVWVQTALLSLNLKKTYYCDGIYLSQSTLMSFWKLLQTEIIWKPNCRAHSTWRNWAKPSLVLGHQPSVSTMNPNPRPVPDKFGTVNYKPALPPCQMSQKLICGSDGSICYTLFVKPWEGYCSLSRGQDPICFFFG